MFSLISNTHTYITRSSNNGASHTTWGWLSSSASADLVHVVSWGSRCKLWHSQRGLSILRRDLGGFNRASSSMLANVVSLLTWNSTRPRKDDLWLQNSEYSSDSQQDNSFQNCCILWKLLLNVSPHVYGMQRLLNLPAPNQNRSEPSLFWLLKSLVQRIRRNALIKLGQQMMFN